MGAMKKKNLACKSWYNLIELKKKNLTTETDIPLFQVPEGEIQAKMKNNVHKGLVEIRGEIC